MKLQLFTVRRNNLGPITLIPIATSLLFSSTPREAYTVENMAVKTEQETKSPLTEEERYRSLFSSLGVQKISPPVKAKDFTLEDLEGSLVSLKDFQGKVVFLNFWATWCPPCRAEMPAMEKLWQKFKEEDFVILAVDLREGKEKVGSFMKENGYTFPVLLDSRGEVANTYGITAVPTTYLLDPEGRTVGKALGARNWASEDAFKLVEDIIVRKSFNISIVNVRITGIGLTGANLEIVFNIRNPSGMAATLDQLDYKIYGNNIYLGDGKINNAISVPARSNKIVSSSFVLNYSSVDKIGRDDLAKGAINWKISIDLGPRLTEEDKTEDIAVKVKEAKLIKLYFSDSQGEYLVPEERKILAVAQIDQEAKEILKELIKGPLDSSLKPTIPLQTEVEDVYVKGDCFYVDFSSSLKEKHPGGSGGELLTIYSIVNTLLINFPSQSGVHILIQGEPAETIAGHFDIRGPLGKRLDIVKVPHKLPEVIWSRKFHEMYLRGAQRTPDGGYIIVGDHRSHDASDKEEFIGLIKTDSQGQKICEARMRYRCPWVPSRAPSFQQTSDGGCILLAQAGKFGGTDYTMYLIKTDATGHKIWDKGFGQNDQSTIVPYVMKRGLQGDAFVRERPDGGYILGGSICTDSNKYQPWLMKTNSKGDIEWEKIFEERGYVFAFQQTSEGGYILACFQPPANGWLIKTDPSGRKTWKRTLEGRSYASSVQETSDGGYILAGVTSTDSDKYQPWLMKTNSKGDIEWEKTFKDENYFCDFIQQTSNGGYILAGVTTIEKYTEYNIDLIKTDAAGQIIWKWTENMESHELKSFHQTSDGGYILLVANELIKVGEPKEPPKKPVIEIAREPQEEEKKETNLKEKTELVKALRELKETMLAKIKWDVDNTAQAFTEVKKYLRARRWADIARPFLRILEDTLILLSKASELKDLSTKINSALSSAKTAYEVFSIVMMIQDLQQTGEKFYCALSGPPYVGAIEQMLEEADATAEPGIGFHSKYYKWVIENYLYGTQGKTPVPRIPRRAATAKREITEFAEGTLKVQESIGQVFNTLIKEIEKSELPEDFPVDKIVFELNELKKQIIWSTGYTTNVKYPAYLQGKTTSVETTLGAIGHLCNNVFDEVAEKVADKTKIETYVELVKLAETIESGVLLLNMNYKIPGVQEPVKITQKITSLTGLSIILYKNSFYSNVEDKFYMLPQEMVLALPTELSNLWQIADDVNQYVLWLLHKKVAPAPVITERLKIAEPPPYYVGDTITAQYTIANKGTAPVAVEVLTVGGRDPDGQVADFSFDHNITLSPNESYKYKGTLTLAKAGNYHFFCAYQTRDSEWNPSVDLSPGLTDEDRTEDITVEVKEEEKEEKEELFPYRVEYKPTTTEYGFSAYLLVNVKGPADELAVILTNPKGWWRTEFISRRDLIDNFESVRVLMSKEMPPPAGTYKLIIKTVTPEKVVYKAEATFTPPAVEITDAEVEIKITNDEYRVGRHGITIRNEGDLPICLRGEFIIVATTWDLNGLKLVPREREIEVPVGFIGVPHGESKFGTLDLSPSYRSDYWWRGPIRPVNALIKLYSDEKEVVTSSVKVTIKKETIK